MIQLAAVLLLAQADMDACAGTEAQLQAAGRALAERHTDEAARILAPLESGHLGCWKVLLALGQLRYEQGDYRRANTFSELAMLNAPENPAVLLLRGQMLVLQNQGARAQELLEKACRLDPNNAEAHYQLGTLYDSNRRNGEAVAEFEKVTQLRPNDARAYDYLALNLEPLGDIRKAEAAYQKALTVNQGPMADPFLDYNYGRLLLKLNQLAEGQKHLDRALQLAPGVRAVFYEHARLNLRLEKLREARADAERALALADPGGYILDLQVYNLLVQIYARLGDKDSALKYARLSEAATIPLRARERR
jgi:tetratricopeptide (TPR) repeat protein